MVEGNTRDTSTQLIAIGVNYRISELFLWVLGPQKPHSRRSRRLHSDTHRCCVFVGVCGGSHSARGHLDLTRVFSQQCA